MTLGEHRASIRKLPLDMDNLHVAICYHNGKEIKYELLCAVAMPEMQNQTAIVFMTESAVKDHIAKGKARMLDGSPIPGQFGD